MDILTQSTLGFSPQRAAAGIGMTTMEMAVEIQNIDGTGGTRKIADLPKDHTCCNPEHYPATMMVWEPGVYEHVCPGCRNVIRFTVPPRPTC